MKLKLFVERGFERCLFLLCVCVCIFFLFVCMFYGFLFILFDTDIWILFCHVAGEITNAGYEKGEVQFLIKWLVF